MQLLSRACRQDEIARDPRIDRLRHKMRCVEDKHFSRDCLDPNKRSIANGISIEFQGGEQIKEVVVEYPVGHRRRREEAIPFIEAKFRTNLACRFPTRRQNRIFSICQDQKTLEVIPVNEFVDLFVI